MYYFKLDTMPSQRQLAPCRPPLTPCPVDQPPPAPCSAGLKAPEVEIRWRNLTVQSTVAVTDKPVPGPLDKLVVSWPQDRGCAHSWGA